MEDVYKQIYGQNSKVTAIHAGLECGTTVSKYPAWASNRARRTRNRECASPIFSSAL
jgi:hypothetical protein